MSMSIVVWIACSVSVPGDLPEPESWKNYGRIDWAYEAESWQVIIESAPSLEVPAEVISINSKTSEAIFATVEPIKADDEAYRFLNSVAVAIATKCGGAVLQGPMGFVRLDEHGKEI
jgi:hypothetical protein